jgi:hypothetical protein
MISIQYQTVNGNWTTVMNTENNSLNILNAMTQVQNSYSGARVRAVDENGRLVDML